MFELGDRIFKASDAALPEDGTIGKLFEKVVFSVHLTPGLRR
jgi:hypothetical protein